MLRKSISDIFQRVSHFLELVGELLLVVALAHYLLYPPTGSTITGWPFKQQGPREYFLILFPMALLLRTWSIHHIYFILVLISFVFTLPYVPLPNDTSFVILLVAFAAQILLLHCPNPPSPLFLFPCHQSLPLSILLIQSASRMFIPIVLFFLPVLLLATLLLSSSLSDTTFKMSPTTTLDSSPIQTRTFILVLFSVAILLLLLCLVMGSVEFPSLSSADMSVTPQGQRWDRYSQRVGLDARKAFVRALVRYSEPYNFPPPLNLLHLLLVRLPWTARYLCGEKGPSPYLDAVEQILWRVSVGPVVAAVAGFWLWGFGADSDYRMSPSESSLYFPKSFRHSD